MKDEDIWLIVAALMLTAILASTMVSLSPVAHKSLSINDWSTNADGMT